MKITKLYTNIFKVFKMKFPNLSFHQPWTNTCNMCDLLYMQCVGAHWFKKVTKLWMNEYHKCPQVMDYMSPQQVYLFRNCRHIAKCTTQDSYMFTTLVSMLETIRVYMFMWHEGITGRSGNEKPCVDITHKRNLKFWSDHCSNQTNTPKKYYYCFLFYLKE